MRIPLPLVIIGGLSTAVVGYAIKEVCVEGGCFGLFDKNSDSNTKEVDIPTKTKTKRKLKSFYAFRQSVLETSYKEFNELISKVQGIDIKDKEEIILSNNLPSLKPYSNEIKQTSKELYDTMESFNDIFKIYIIKILSMIEISTSYEAYSDNSKTIIDNAIKLSSIIYDILALNVIDEEDNLTQDSFDLLKKCNKLMQEYVSEQSKKLLSID